MPEKLVTYLFDMNDKGNIIWAALCSENILSVLYTVVRLSVGILGSNAL